MARPQAGPFGRTRCLTSILAVLMMSLAVPATAAAQTLAGRVIDPDRRPVADARVLVARGETVVATARTDAGGRFGPLPVPPGEYLLTVSAPGLGTAPRSITVTPDSSQQVDLPLAVTAVRESIVVSAAQVETPLSRATDTVTVFDADELEMLQTATVADALRLVPGFNVAASGGLGAITSVFPRGGESDYTLVLVDGIPQNAFGGGFDAAHLGTAGLERIEVVRGPESALHGNGAIGGVVQLVTRQGGPVRALASFEGGGYGFLRSTGSASGSAGAWRWGGSFERLLTDGDTRETGRLDLRVANDDYDRLAGAGSLGWSDRPSRVIRVDVRADRDIRGYPGPYGSDPLGLYSGVDLVSRGRAVSRGVGASAVLGQPPTGRHHLQFTWSDDQSEYASPFGPSEDETRRATGRYQLDVELPRVGVSGGWEILHERTDNTFITGERFDPVPIARLNSGLFFEARPSLGSRLVLTAGARLERIERRALESSPGARPAFDDDVTWSLNPKISAAWFARGLEAANWTKLRMSAGTGIKPPTGFEIAYTDNPSLKPERNRSVDAGIEQAFAGSSLVADLTWFLNRYDDLIVAVGSAGADVSRYQTDNIANAQATGVEAGVRWRAANGLGGRASWTWLETEVLGIDRLPTEAPFPYAVGDALVRRPRHQASGEVSWTRSRGSAFLLVGGRGRMNDLEANFASSLARNPGYVTFEFGGAFAISPRFEVYGRVMNALDRRYEEVFGYPALGRRGSIGVRVAAGR